MKSLGNGMKVLYWTNENDILVMNVAYISFVYVFGLLIQMGSKGYTNE